ncbi:MAG: poly-gamma-glutamate biosynthesis protein PgsC [Lachnospiraceae bacterium]|nr:poly-gamma-glutamate biosynthesis protein PgsC [Lachnospiraceae bacterium]
MYNQTIILGVVLSILFTEWTGLSPAGIIVPGYIALSLHSPQRIGVTLLVALVTMILCRLLGRIVILYGRRRFAAAIIIAFLLSEAMGVVFPGTPSMIGCLIPGIIARDLDRQGVAKTLLSLAVVTGILVLVLLAMGWPIVTI